MCQPELIAGGATQNSVRVAQWIFGDKAVGRTAYVGCIGNDDDGRQPPAAANADGVATYYLVDEETPTGTCAVLINDTERSLVANLAAANKYNAEHFATEELKAVLADASVVYSSGFFLTVSVDSMIAAGKHCAEAGKTYALNLAAPFIPQFFKDQLMAAFPFMCVDKLRMHIFCTLFFLCFIVRNKSLFHMYVWRGGGT